jgi:hypothetical protein
MNINNVQGTARSTLSQRQGKLLWCQALLQSYENLIIFSLAPDDTANKTNHMKNYTKILFSILAAVICTATFAADKPTCKKTGKNCPMNDNKECNCGKSCDC